MKMVLNPFTMGDFMRIECYCPLNLGNAVIYCYHNPRKVLTGVVVGIFAGLKMLNRHSAELASPELIERAKVIPAIVPFPTIEPLAQESATKITLATVSLATSLFLGLFSLCCYWCARNKNGPLAAGEPSQAFSPRSLNRSASVSFPFFSQSSSNGIKVAENYILKKEEELVPSRFVPSLLNESFANAQKSNEKSNPFLSWKSAKVVEKGLLKLEEKKSDHFIKDVAVASTIGPRDRMEDFSVETELRLNINGELKQVSLFGVFDGHSGPSCAQYLKDNIPLYLGKKLPEILAIKEANERLAALYNFLLTLYVNLGKEYREKMLPIYRCRIGAFYLNQHHKGCKFDYKDKNIELDEFFRVEKDIDIQRKHIEQLLLQVLGKYHDSNLESIYAHILSESICALPGSTAVLALLIDGILWVVNAGDSRAILCYAEKGKSKVCALSKDDAIDRNGKSNRKVEEYGGSIEYDREDQTYRVYKNGIRTLNMTAAVGHDPVKTSITARADIIAVDLRNFGKMDYLYLVEGSDGFFGAPSSQEVANSVQGCVGRDLTNSNAIATYLLKKAERFKKEIDDNITVSVANLSRFLEKPQKHSQILESSDSDSSDDEETPPTSLTTPRPSLKISTESTGHEVMRISQSDDDGFRGFDSGDRKLVISQT